MAHDSLEILVISLFDLPEWDVQTRSVPEDLEDLQARVTLFGRDRVARGELRDSLENVDGALLVVPDDGRCDPAGSTSRAVSLDFAIGAALGALGSKRVAGIRLARSRLEGSPTQPPPGRAAAGLFVDDLRWIPYDAAKKHRFMKDLRTWCDALRERKDGSFEARLDGIAESLRELPQRVGALFPRCPLHEQCVLPAGIVAIHSDRHAAYGEIMRRISSATKSVSMLGIALRPFFHSAGAYYEKILETLDKSLEWRVLVLDPHSDEALLRSLRENQATYRIKLSKTELDYRQKPMEELRKTYERAYQETDVYRDIQRTTEFFLDNARNGKKRASAVLRWHRGAPVAFVVIVDDRSLFVEQYHYGRVDPETNMRVGERVPVFEYASSSSMFQHMRGHFEHLWGNLSREPS